VSLGYYSIAVFAWEKWLILIVFVTALILNFILQAVFKKQKEEVKRAQTNDNLKATIEKCKSDVQAAFYLANR
jgi:cell division protein FtsB